MMVTRNIYKVLCFVCAICGLCSCSDWLDVKSDTIEREKELYKTYDGFTQALAGCYTAMASRNIYGEKLTMTDIEHLACLWSTPDRERQPELYYMKLHDYNNDDSRSEIRAIYGGLYKVIGEANIVLGHVETDGNVIKSPQSRGIIKAEALALRAFCHFDVLRLFGQMPVGGTKSIRLPYAEKSSIDEQAPYYDYNAFVGKIEADLNEAEQLLREYDPILQYSVTALNQQGANPVKLDDSFLQYRQFRLNYYAVKAVKARLYLYTGQPQKAYTEAKSILDATLDGEKVFQLSGIGDIAADYYALPSECVFALSNPTMIDYSITLLGGDRTKQVDTYYQQHITSDMLTKELFLNQGTASNNRYLQVWNKDVVNIQNMGMPTIRKYFYNANDYMRSDDVSTLRTKLQIVPLIRLSEIYLIVLETTNDLGEANRLYVDYMASHNVNITTQFESLDAVRSEVFDEYRREFYAEGVMFYTYKRTGTKKIWWSYEEMGDDQYVLPVPSSEYDPGK